MNKMYQAAGITKQGYHQSINRQNAFEKKLMDLLLQVDILRSDHPGCGVEKMYHTLRPAFLGRDRFVEIMMSAGYRVTKQKNYIKTTISGYYNYPNLIEGSMVTDVNQVWQSDITYVKVGADYFYAVFIIDVYSRRIIGYNASDNLRAVSNVKALKQAFRLRGNSELKDLIHHSDRGSQYTSKKYTKMLETKDISISMGLVATDNSYAERINGTIKNEFLRHWEIKDLRDLKRKLKKAVDYYNNKRPHNHLPQRMSPLKFEKELLDSDIRKRPTVTIYTDGNDKIKEASSLIDLDPEKGLWIHNCPIYNDQFINP